MALFGGMPIPVQFVVAFVIVLALIGITAWVVRRLGAGRLGGVGLRGRQPRLAVIDYASVDARRRLILVRRDNVEHLLMIGGPTDVLVESSIVRASAAPREGAIARPPAAAEMLPRSIALADSPAHGSWPLAPEPAAPAVAARAPRSEAVVEESGSWPLQPPAEGRGHRETLAALADELSTKPLSPTRSRPTSAARPQLSEPRLEMRQESRADSRMAPTAAAEPAIPADQGLAEMAYQLEAALRKPNAKPGRNDAREARAAIMPRANTLPESSPSAEDAPVSPQPPPIPALAPRGARPADAKPPHQDAKQPNAGKALYDSLEQEMASLLGRPNAKN